MRGELDLGVRTALEGLRMLGQEIPERPSAARMHAEYESMCAAFGDRTIESLVDLPFMDDPEMNAAMSIMRQLWLASYFTDMNLSQTVICRLVKLMLLHGISEPATFACAGLCMCLGPAFHRYADADRFARTAVAIAERGGYVAYQSAAYLAMEMAVLWTRPVSEALACLDTSFKLAQEVGVPLYATYGIQHRITNLMFRGDSLDEVWRESVAGLSFAERGKVKHSHAAIMSMQAFIQAMRGRPEDRTEVGDVTLDARIQACGAPVVICFHWILRMQRHFLLEDAAGALEFAAKAAPIMWSVQNHIQSVDFCVFQSLAIARIYPQTDADRQEELRKTLEANLATLARLADSYVSSLLDKHALVAAELARIDEREMEALHLYERAIKAAADSGFTHDGALASELAACFCLARGLERAGRAHLREAREGYLRWGAGAKVALLDEQFPGIDRPVIQTRPTTIEASVEQLDLSAIIKVSQALSSEIVTGRLIERLMVIAIEHAGAQRGLLILEEGMSGAWKPWPSRPTAGSPCGGWAGPSRRWTFPRPSLHT